MACADVREALSQSAVVAKLTDFGMAARLRDGEQYVADVRQGTPFYIAPEVVREHRLHTASDVYAFGVIMWELMRGFFSYQRGCVPPAGSNRLPGRSFRVNRSEGSTSVASFGLIAASEPPFHQLCPAPLRCQDLPYNVMSRHAMHVLAGVHCVSLAHARL